MHLVQLAQPVQLRQVTPDGGLAGAQRLAQLLHGSRALFAQQIQDLPKPFFCQHGLFSPLRPVSDGF